MRMPKCPPLIALVLIILEVILHYFLPIYRLFPIPLNYFLGVLIFLLGMLSAITGLGAFRKNNVNFRPGTRSRILVTKGIYGYSRNPMYLGILLVLMGIAVFLGTLSPFISPVLLFLFMNYFMMPFEERLLEKRFGKSYLDYKRKVRRWI